MYEKILVTLDGSPLAETILPYVVRMATSLNLPVSLLHAVDPDSISDLTAPERGRYADQVEEDLKQRSSSYLSQIAASFPESVAGECHVHVGKAADVIADYARREEKALIAMATHGYSGVKRMWLGSIAMKVLHVCANPMLLIRASEESKAADETTVSSIIVPLDGSGLAETVLPHAAYIAAGLGVPVTLFRVYSLMPTMYSVAGYPSLELEGTARDRIKEEIERYLSDKVEELRSRGVRDVDSVAVQGDAATEIIDMAEKTKHSMVAMSTHGKTGVARWVLGSVTDKVVRQSGDAVLIVRSPSVASG